MIKRLTRFGALLVTLVSGAALTACTEAAASVDGELVAYLTPTCGCCLNWVEHMRENGFEVRVVYQDDLSDVRSRYGVPVEVTSCHLGVVDGYAVEGHVPADVVRRMLRERPDVLGLAVPGMVAGSPGMEMPDGRVDPYNIYSFDESGPVAVYDSRR